MVDETAKIAIGFLIGVLVGILMMGFIFVPRIGHLTRQLQDIGEIEQTQTRGLGNLIEITRPDNPCSQLLARQLEEESSHEED